MANKTKNIASELAKKKAKKRKKFAPRTGHPTEFDPESKGYDMRTAKRYDISPNKSGHWPSREPKTGVMLKGRQHKTWDKAVKGERNADPPHEIYKGNSGRYYSRKK